MTYTYKTTIAPVVEPVTREEVKAHVQGVDWPDDDALIDSYISTAREWMETALNRALITQTIRATLALPRAVSSPLGGAIHKQRTGLALPRPPLLAVSLVEVETQVATWQTVASNDYAVDPTTSPAACT
jgi:predicted RNA-binding Zn ribbon-like protein